MSSSLITNIKSLTGIREGSAALRGGELAVLNAIANAYLLIEGDQIAAFGRMDALSRDVKLPDQVFDASGRFVLPAWCDSHTHLVYPAPREEEFVDKIKGLSYAQIAANGGGILNSARKLAEASEEQLFRDAFTRLQQAAAAGTGSIEIKSGYGLSVEGELKMLRVIQQLKNHSPMNIRATFLGAHAYPTEYLHDHQGYIKLITEEMLPVIAREKLADYIDVFCENGFFSNEETEAICVAGRRLGLIPKIHANQLSATGAVQTGIKVNAISVDHLEVMDEAAILALAASPVIGTLLPTAAFFLRMPYQPARQLIDAGCALAVASDCNPGSSPGFSMNFVVSLCCIGMKMLPEEAINAATFNGACAMHLQDITGSIAVGKKADLIITKPISSLAYLPYSFSRSMVDRTIIKGKYFTFDDETF